VDESTYLKYRWLPFLCICEECRHRWWNTGWGVTVRDRLHSPEHDEMAEWNRSH